MKCPVEMGLSDRRRVYAANPVARGNARGDVVVQPLERIVHIAVLAHPPIQPAEIVIYHPPGPFQQPPRFPQFGMLVPVEYVGLGDTDVAILNEHFLHKVLNFFHCRYPPISAGDSQDRNHLFRHPLSFAPVTLLHRLERFEYRLGYLVSIEGDDISLPFPDMLNFVLCHLCSLLTASTYPCTQRSTIPAPQTGPACAGEVKTSLVHYILKQALRFVNILGLAGGCLNPQQQSRFCGWGNRDGLCQTNLRSCRE